MHKALTVIVLPKLQNIRRRREALGMTQRELARVARVEPSMINQIEKGTAQPRYEVAERIFSHLDTLEAQSTKKAGDICTRDITTVRPGDSLNDAIRIMAAKKFSQLPVFDFKGCVGLVTEQSVLRYTLEYDDERRQSIKVKDAMETSPPIIDFEYPVTREITKLLLQSKCVLVSKENKIVGIITPIDIIKKANS